jgi:hypothetical protein
MSSICIFGSTARNRIDDFSDRDVLIVANSSFELSASAENWRRANWSVASFTECQMLDIASRGSLFVQHLKLEGIIVADKNGFLASTFAKYSPQPDCAREIEGSVALLRYVSGLVLSDWGALCSSDIAYVAIRNVAIHQLASQGVYKFDYNDVVDGLGRSRRIDPASLKAVRGLRHFKYAYRNRIGVVGIHDALQKALREAEMLFELDIFGAEHEEPVLLDYAGLRVLELSLVDKVPPQYLDCLPSSDPLATPWAMICDPRGYPKPWKIDDSWISDVADLVRERFGQQCSRR